MFVAISQGVYACESRKLILAWDKYNNCDLPGDDRMYAFMECFNNLHTYSKVCYPVGMHRDCFKEGNEALENKILMSIESSGRTGCDGCLMGTHYVHALLDCQTVKFIMFIPICKQFHYAYGDSQYANFPPSSPYAYGESPYVYWDQFVTCQQSFLESCVEPDFCACTCTQAHQKHHHIAFDSITPHLRSKITHNHSPFAISLTSDLIILCCQIWNLSTSPTRVEGVPALPEFPQQAPKANSTQQEAAGSETDIWIIDATDGLDEDSVCHKNALYVLLKVNEWFHGRDYMCTLLTKQVYNEILQFYLNLMNGADPWSLFIAVNKQAYKWAAKYDAIVVEEESVVLVLGPTKVQDQSLHAYRDR